MEVTHIPFSPMIAISSNGDPVLQSASLLEKKRLKTIHSLAMLLPALVYLTPT